MACLGFFDQKFAWCSRMRLNELKKLIRGGFPPFQVEVLDLDDNVISVDSFESLEKTVEYIIKQFSGNLRGVKKTIEEKGTNVMLLLEKKKVGKVRILFRQKKQLNLMQFIL